MRKEQRLGLILPYITSKSPSRLDPTYIHDRFLEFDMKSVVGKCNYGLLCSSDIFGALSVKFEERDLRSREEELLKGGGCIVSAVSMTFKERDLEKNHMGVGRLQLKADKHVYQAYKKGLEVTQHCKDIASENCSKASGNTC